MYIYSYMYSSVHVPINIYIDICTHVYASNISIYPQVERYPALDEVASDIHLKRGMWETRNELTSVTEV